MHRSFWVSAVLAVLMVLAPFAGTPAGVLVAAADPATLSAAADAEVIVIESTGRLRVYDPTVQPGTESVAGYLGTDLGWKAVAAGDFNADGDAEIVAIGGSKLKVFDPVQQPGSLPVSYELTLTGGKTFSQVVTGDFNDDGRAEIAVLHTETAANIKETLLVLSGGATGQSWSQTYTESYGMAWVDLSAADFNADGADDLALARNPSQSSKLIKIYNGRTWAGLLQRLDSFPWLALAGGDISLQYSGDELALTRGGVLGERNSVVLFRVSGSTLVDLVPNANYKYYPYFTSVALGDLNGDADKEVVLLRDPRSNTTALFMLNPAGVAMREFKQAIGYNTTAWRLVRTGDTDGDGRDEIVVERGTGFRIYTDPQTNDVYADTAVSLYTVTDSNLSTMAVANVDGPGVVPGPSLYVTPTQLTFNVEYGQASPTQTVAITNAGTSEAIPWQAQALGDAANWLVLDKTTGTTPGSLGVSIATNKTLPGTYTGTIRITSSAAEVVNSPQDVTVSVTVTGVGMVVAPLSLSFSIKAGDAVPTQALSIASASGTSAFPWQAVVLEGGAWLQLSRTSGTTPSTVQVGVNSLAVPPGQYAGTIKVTAQTAAGDPPIANGVQYIPVSLVVADAGLLVVPDKITIMQRVAGPRVVKTIQILRPGLEVEWAASAVDAGLAETAGLDVVPTWLGFTPDTGRTPSNMTVQVTTDTPGSYRAVITIVATDPSVPNGIRTVQVEATVVTGQQFVPMLFK